MNRLVAAALLLILAAPLHAQTTPAPAPASAPATAPASTAPVVDAKAAEVLHKVADYYKTVKTASAQINIAMKFEGAGHKEEMHATATFAVERPNKLALVLKDDKGGGGSVVADGKKLWLTLADKKQYSEEADPASLDETLVNSPAQLVAQQASILLVLFHSQPYDKLLDGVTAVTYAGQDDIDGAKYDHLRTGDGGRGCRSLDRRRRPAAPPPRQARPLPPAQAGRSAAAGNEGRNVRRLDRYEELDDRSTDRRRPVRLHASAPGFDKVDSMEEVLVGDQPAMKLKACPLPISPSTCSAAAKRPSPTTRARTSSSSTSGPPGAAPASKVCPSRCRSPRTTPPKTSFSMPSTSRKTTPPSLPFLKQHNLDVKVGLDKDGAISKAFMVQGIPQTIIIGKDGIIKVVHIGTSPKLKDLMTHDLEKVIAGK